uniref:Uncharacterized protein n=1 Tax=Anguilla anguilla TaxID=7936 RepID=A0A0E9WUC9_ANGAN
MQSIKVLQGKFPMKQCTCNIHIYLFRACNHMLCNHFRGQFP